MPRIEKEIPHIIFVNSVKGGAGKTTIALSLSASFVKDEMEAQSANKGTDEEKVHGVCYIDADILGTGVYRILFGNKAENITFFNERTQPYTKYIKTVKLLDVKSTNGPIGDPGYFDCILLSDDPREKGRYVKDPHTRKSHINMNVFENRFMDLLDKLAKSGKYKYIIVDCPPGFDSLSRKLLAHTSGLAGKKFGRSHNLLVTTLDATHMHTTLSLAYHIFAETGNIVKPSIIINDSVNYEPRQAEYEADITKRLRDDLRMIKDTNKLKYESSVETKDIPVFFYKHTKFAESMIYTNNKQIHETKEWQSLCEISHLKFAQKLLG